MDEADDPRLQEMASQMTEEERTYTPENMDETTANAFAAINNDGGMMATPNTATATVSAAAHTGV